MDDKPTTPIPQEDLPSEENALTWAAVGRALRQTWQALPRLVEEPPYAALLLVAILILAGAFRFTGLDWDEGQHLHPDERFLTMVENSLQWPKSWGEYWDTAVNPLNPNNHNFGSYVYGLFPVVVTKFMGELLGMTGYGAVYLVGRALSGVMDLLSIVIVFLLGRRLYNARVGLVGALLGALTVLTIQQSHFFTVDNFTTFFITLALYAAVRVAQGEGWGSVLLLGVAFGLAVSCKINALTFLLIIGLAFILRAARRAALFTEAPAHTRQVRLGRFQMRWEWGANPLCGPLPSRERFFAKAVEAIPALLLVLVVAFWTFRIVQPQAFTGPGFFDVRLNPQWLEQMDFIRKLVGGEIDYPPSHQWAARAPVLYMLEHMVLWGLGLPLGLAVWAAWALMAYELYHLRWKHLLPWAWMTFTFFYQSVQFVKTVRYLLPIYPTMALMAAYGLVYAWDWARRPRRGRLLWLRRLTRGAVRALVIVIVVGTGLWALAFTSIYTRPVTRVAASRWIFQNIPKGSTLSYELWDDALPLNIDGRLADANYRQIRMDLYWEDVPEKREQLYRWLQDTEYIILSSNRLYGSIPRLPMRYPMTRRYYQALFSGELGYELFATFTSYPRIFGLEIVDDAADESFTVYDHPKVLIFKKRPDFSLENVKAILGGYDLDRVVRMLPKQVSAAPNGLMLYRSEWAAQQTGGTWIAIFNPASLMNQFPLLWWLVILEGVGWVAFPLAFVALSALRDRGFALAKAVGLLLWGYVTWLLPSLKWVPYSRELIAGALAGLALLSLGVGIGRHAEMAAFFKARWRLVIAYEVIFLAAFGAFLWVRCGNPDLWHPVTGGEKPMDLAYLTAILKSVSFPPYDPWFAGGAMNYYYFGWVLLASIIKLTGIVPEVAYNLAIPTLFALVFSGAVGIVYNLTASAEEEGGWFPRPLRYGLAGGCLLAILGNLGELTLVVGGLRQLGEGVAFQSRVPLLKAIVQVGAGLWQVLSKRTPLPFRSEWWYWNPTRVMKFGEINEFPFFSFLYGDLHAHILAMALALLALGAALQVALRSRARAPWEGRPAAPWPGILGRLGLSTDTILSLGLGSLVLGALWAANTWDYPTYTLIFLIALAIGVYEERRRFDRQAWLWLGVRGASTVVASYLLFGPFHGRFGSAYSQIERWRGPRTPLGDYVIIHGVFLFILAFYLLALAFRPGVRNGVARTVRLFWHHWKRRWRAWVLYERWVRCPTLGYSLAWVALALGGAVWLGLVMAGAWLWALALPLVGVGAALCLSARLAPERRLQAVWITLGLAMTLAVEVVVLKGDIGRMNTVFKFYLQVWILWALSAGAGLAYLARDEARWPRRWRALWRWGLGVLLLAASMYPPLATWARLRDRWDPSLPPTLDGMAYMTTAAHSENGSPITLEYDRRAIWWMREHIPGTPVVAEANTPFYRWGGRISVYTGLPTILGWDWHQKQQRAAYSGLVVDWRQQDVNDLYNTHDVSLARQIIARYNVRYIYVGELEAAYYDPAGLAKFEAMVGTDLEVVYRDGPVTIYRVLGGEGVTGAVRPMGLGRQIAHWLRAHWVPPVVKAEAPAEANPMLSTPVEELPVLRDRGWNRLANASPIGAILCWWGVLQLIGLAAWPLARRVFGAEDGGYALAKPLGLLVLSYGLWLGMSLRLVRNTPLAAWVGLALLGGVCTLLWGWRWRRAARPFAWRLLAAEEGLFSAAFAAWVVLRLLNPDLWQPWFGGEKMMEIAFLNAITRSAYMPPYDPYFAGGIINYYYYGYFMVNILVKMTGLRPEVAFNVAVPTFFALMASITFWAGRSLTRLGMTAKEGEKGHWAIWGGAAAVFFVVLAGNLTGAKQLLDGLAQAGGAPLEEGRRNILGYALPGLVRIAQGKAVLPPFDYWWGGTRVIPGTISEFPFFTFLFADLHPHLMALPFTALALAALVDMGASREAWLAPDLWRWGALALTVGALGAINTWDLPTYLGLACLGLCWAGWRSRSSRGILMALLGCATLVAGAFFLYSPFYAHYRPQYVGFKLALVPQGLRSRPKDWNLVWGGMLFLSASGLCYGLRLSAAVRTVGLIARYGARRAWGTLRRFGVVSPAKVAGLLCLVGLTAAGAALAAGQGFPTVGILLALVVLAAWNIALCRREARALPYALILLGLLIIAGTEVFYLRDFLEGSEWRRMNTVFKFGLQAWVLIGLGGAALFPLVWKGWRGVWRGAAALCLIAVAVYPLKAVPVRVEERFPEYPGPRWTLDGTAYMENATYTWPDETHRIAMRYDREALEWLWQNVEGTPVILEAPVGFYREGGLRISSYTGFPTLLGAHEGEQRPWPVVAERERDAIRLYTTPYAEEAAHLLEKYRVRYVYIGPLERVLYAEEGLRGLEALAEQGALWCVFQNEGVTIYRVQPTQPLEG